MKEVKRIGVTEILGREIVFYGNWEEPLFYSCKGSRNKTRSIFSINGFFSKSVGTDEGS